MKVITVVPISLPALLALFIFAMDDEMEKNTIGTTTQNIMLINSVPRGSRAPAPGQANPTIIPSTIPRIIVKKNQLFLRKFFDFIPKPPMFTVVYIITRIIAT